MFLTGKIVLLAWYCQMCKNSLSDTVKFKILSMETKTTVRNTFKASYSLLLFFLDSTLKLFTIFCKLLTLTLLF